MSMLTRSVLALGAPVFGASGRSGIGAGVRGYADLGGKSYAEDEWTNVTPAIAQLVGRDLHLNASHPVGILRQRIEERLKPLGFTPFNQFKPVVSVHDNFDALGFPADHPGRSKSDTYYANKDTLLRTHTSAHEIECFQSSPTPGYLISADVYRRDSVDRTHYPAFHQMEGARTWSTAEPDLVGRLRRDLEAIPRPRNFVVEDPHPPFHAGNPKQANQSDEVTELLGQNLKRTVELLMADLFQTDDVVKARWIEAYFPWTSPSWEIEIWWNGEWLEMCGCGVVQHQVYKNAGMPDNVGWAFGIGLERAAMILFGIPDIRLFWSQHPKFLSQFRPGEISRFEPWSKFPSTSRDVAFWNTTGLHENDVMEIVRNEGGDLVESVSLVDDFTHPKTGKTSLCYRVNYQSMDHTLTSDETNAIQEHIVEALRTRGAEIR